MHKFIFISVAKVSYLTDTTGNFCQIKRWSKYLTLRAKLLVVRFVRLLSNYHPRPCGCNQHFTQEYPSACYRFWSDCSYSLVPASAGGPPLLPPPLFFLFRTEEPTKASTCAHDRRALQQFALNVHVKHSDLTWWSSCALVGIFATSGKFCHVNTVMLWGIAAPRGKCELNSEVGKIWKHCWENITFFWSDQMYS